MKQSRIDFIKEGHAAACKEWKTKIEEEFPSIFVESKQYYGKWLWINTSTSTGTERGLVFHTNEPLRYEKSYYGWDMGGDWTITFSLFNMKEDIHRIATDAEVSRRIREEMDRRYKYPQPIKYLDGKIGRLKGASGTLIKNEYFVTHGTHDAIYSFGQWAKPVLPISKENAQKELNRYIDISNDN